MKKLVVNAQSSLSLQMLADALVKVDPVALRGECDGKPMTIKVYVMELKRDVLNAQWLAVSGKTDFDEPKSSTFKGWYSDETNKGEFEFGDL
jgi:hypothetical protein